MASFDIRSTIPDNCVCVAFIDTTYPNFGDSYTESLALKVKLESELSAELEEVDIYPGASGPGWLFELPLSEIAIAAGFYTAFFSGKNILENIAA